MMVEFYNPKISTIEFYKENTWKHDNNFVGY